MAVATEEDCGSITATQTEENIEEQVRTKFGNLSRDAFKDKIVQDVAANDLLHIRDALYDLCLRDIDSTPRGTLVTRKDSTRTGGQSVDYKVADDIYQIYHYYQGDTSVDLLKLFTERSRAQLLKTNEESGNTDNDRAHQDPEIELPLKDFCIDLLKQMREDRDTIRKDIQSYKQENAELKQAVKRLTADIIGERKSREKVEQIIDLELKKLHERVDEIRVFKAHADAELRGLQASVNTRVANLDIRITATEKRTKSDDSLQKFQGYCDKTEDRLQKQIDMVAKQMHAMANIVRPPVQQAPPQNTRLSTTAPPPPPVNMPPTQGHPVSQMVIAPAVQQDITRPQTRDQGKGGPSTTTPVSQHIQPGPSLLSAGTTGRREGVPPVQSGIAIRGKDTHRPQTAFNPLNTQPNQDITFGFTDTQENDEFEGLEGFTTVRKRRTEYVYVANIRVKSDADSTI